MRYILTVRPPPSAKAPLSGALIATYTTWRVVFGITSGATLIAFSLCFFLVPSAKQLSGGLESEKAESRPSLSDVFRAFNPSAVFRQLKYPRVLFCVGFPHYSQCSVLEKHSITTRERG